MHHEDHDQALAAALAALLLVGITLIVREIAGLWPATALGMGTVLVAFWGPAAARRIVVWHKVRRFRRHIAAHSRIAG
jgi:predicted anti-sigma-YlaC factor YlaD